MRRYAVPALAALIALLVATPAQAQTYFDQAVTALKAASLYIAPGSNATPDEQNALGQLMNTSDNIKVALLPSTASKEVGTDLTTFAARLQRSLGANAIVAVAVGNDVAVASDKALANSQAQRQLSIAEDISTSPAEVIENFIQNVHYYQQQNPTKVITGKKKTGSSSHLPVIIGIMLLVGASIMTILVILRRRTPIAEMPDLPDPPGTIPSLLKQIEVQIPSIDDESTCETLNEICHRVAVLFDVLGRNADPHSTRMATEAFEDHLGKLVKTVKRYIGIQDNPEYYSGNADMHLTDGRMAFLSVDRNILESIRRANDGELMDFTVDTKILNTTRV